MLETTLNISKYIQNLVSFAIEIYIDGKIISPNSNFFEICYCFLNKVILVKVDDPDEV